MKVFLYLVLIFVSSFGFSQNSKLQGRWILDKIVLDNKEEIPPFARDFSFINTLYFKGNLVELGNRNFNYEATSSNIKTPFRNIKYRFNDDYLILKDQDDYKELYYLSEKDYLKKYPEFNPTTVKIKDKDIYLANEVVKPYYNSTLAFEEYMDKFLPKFSLNKNEPKFFKANFVIKKDGSLGEVFIVNSVSANFDAKFLHLLKNAEKYMKNNFDVDLLVTYTYAFDLNKYETKEEKKFNKLFEDSERIYFTHDFEKALSAQQKLFNEGFSTELLNRYQTKFNEAKIRLGVCYYMLNQPQKACEVFAEVGDVTKLSVRNYLLNLCK